MGLLRWRQRFQKVVVPFSYRPDVWTARLLSPKEMCNVLDVPVDRVKELKLVELEEFIREEIPGKVLGACLWFLGEVETISEDQALQKKRPPTAEVPATKRARTMMIPEQSQQVYEGIGADEVPSSADLFIKGPALAPDSEPGYSNE